MNLSLLIEDENWSSLVDVDLEAAVGKVCALTLSRAPALDALTEQEREQLGLSAVLTDDAAVRELNRQFRTKDMPTNILSFPAYENVKELRKALAAPAGAPMLEDVGYLGDMILARETIMREAKEQGKAVKDHVCHLLVHGTLHLLGYDHISTGEAEEMEALEISILKELSIANPYE